MFLALFLFKNACFCTFFDCFLWLKSTIWAACSRITFCFTMSFCHMASQPIRGCKTHTTNLADRTCDDDLFSFISKKSHETQWLFLIKNVQNGCFLHTLYTQVNARKNQDLANFCTCCSRNTTLVIHPIVSLRHKNTTFYILEVSATTFYA